jgi:hypothetical protein
MEAARTNGQYFWSSWMRGLSFGQLAWTFILLSLADLMATVQLLDYGIAEGNPLANATYLLSGPDGLIVYKAFLVTLILGLTWVIHRKRPALAINLLWASLLLMAVIALRHLAIIWYVVT